MIELAYIFAVFMFGAFCGVLCFAIATCGARLNKDIDEINDIMKDAKDDKERNE